METQAVEEIMALYNISGEKDRWVAEQIIDHLGDLLQAASAGIASPQVLDLACGKAESYPHLPPTLYEPWLSRIAAHSGFNVTGIDIEPGPLDVKSSPGTWNYESRDLLEPTALAHIPDESFNVVALRGLVHTFMQSEIAPELDRLSWCNEDLYLKKRDHLIGEITRILRKKGRLILNSFVLEKPESTGNWTMIFDKFPFPKNELEQIKPELLQPPFRTKRIQGRDFCW